VCKIIFILESIQSSLASGLLENLQYSKQKSFRSMFINASDDALDLLQKLLQFNPKKRITVEQALEHSFFKDVRNAEEEINCDSKMSFEISEELKLEIKIYKINYLNNLEEKKARLKTRGPSNSMNNKK
jgi:mitogen-activated protein kinase 15